MTTFFVKEKAPVLQEFFSGRAMPPVEPVRQGQRQRALAILHQMIDDAHKGKRQFLSGKEDSNKKLGFSMNFLYMLSTP